jgi:ERCC4-type nuclease
MIIKVDSNELVTAPWVVTQIREHPLLGAPEITSLPAGDVWIEDKELFIFERKNPHDLIESIKDKRLFNQCCEMRLESSQCHVVIIGQMGWGMDGKIVGTGFNFRAIEGAILRCLDYGVYVSHCQNQADFATHLIWLLKRDRTEHVFLPQRTGLAMPDDQRILASLPGIGPERAGELLKERNLRDALLCLIDPECKVKGIGPAIKKNIRELLNLNQGEKLEVTKNE